VPNVLSLGLIQKVLQRLLRERVPIRDLLTILETLADYVNLTKNVDILTGYVRQALARTITKQYRDAKGDITVVTLAPAIEEAISRAVQHTEYESYVAADPDLIQKVITGLQKYIPQFTSRGLQPVVLCSPQTRIHLRNIVERFFPNLAVISHNEVTRDVNIKSLGMVE